MDLGAEAPPAIAFAPDKLQALQKQYAQEAIALFSQGGVAPALTKDRRFANPAWGENPLAAFSAAAYLLTGRTMMGLADAVQADPKTCNRIKFAVEQGIKN